MPGEIYNPNPTVFSPAKQHSRKFDAAFHSLWLNASPEGADDAQEVELIDQDEVFGRSITTVSLMYMLIRFLCRIDTLDI